MEIDTCLIIQIECRMKESLLSAFAQDGSTWGREDWGKAALLCSITILGKQQHPPSTTSEDMDRKRSILHSMFKVRCCRVHGQPMIS